MAGLRVVRGPNWSSGNEDGGEGYVGTVTEVLRDDGKAVVIWDNGAKKVYRAGHNGAFDLYIFDNAQIDVRHSTVTCDECKEEGIKGIRWKCSVCHNYDLCSSCYGQDKHDMSHSFLRFDAYPGTGKLMTSRRDSQKQKLKAQGIFKGATVTRGVNWRWGDQDGGENSKGSVIDITDWEPSFRTKIAIKWTNGSSYNYRVGHRGKVDLKCVKPAFGGAYYKSHLAPFDVKDAVDPTEDSDDDDMTLSSLLARAFLQKHIEKTITEGVPAMLAAALKHAVSQNKDTISPGIRVVRGPDWKWGDQDGGDGHVGTVTEVGSAENKTLQDKCVRVVWDNGSKNIYRIGVNDAFDLRVLDNAPSGVKHENISCYSCNVESIQGIRWQCCLCFNFNLCSNCYYRNDHEITHFFWRYDYPNNKRFKVPRRCDSRQTERKGIFVDAVVCRGPDWQWGDQDAGAVANGVVLNIKSWSDTGNSAADVLWANEKQNCYRVGYNGKVDLKLVTASSGGYYYKDHLPILGKVEVTPCEFKVGDIVRCCYDAELVKILQRNHGGWTEDMGKYMKLNGTVIDIEDHNDVVVKYGDGKRWYFNSDALSKVDDLTSVTHSPMDTDVVKKVIELGFDRNIIERVTLKYFSQGKGCFASVEALIDKVLELQAQGTQSRDIIQTDNEIALNENQMVDTLAEASGGTNTVAHSDTVSENQRLAEENRQLKEQRQCKICMDLEACVTFVPCGHLIACGECFSGLELCPMCRARIESTLRTYIS